MFNLEDPAGAERVLVDQLRRVGQLGVRLADRARDRGEHVGNGLDRFNVGGGIAFLQFLADGGQVDVHDVAQFMLGIVGDPDHDRVAFAAHPFMFLAEKKIFLCHVRSSYLFLL